MGEAGGVDRLVTRPITCGGKSNGIYGRIRLSTIFFSMDKTHRSHDQFHLEFHFRLQPINLVVATPGSWGRGSDEQIGAFWSDSIFRRFQRTVHRRHGVHSIHRLDALGGSFLLLALGF